MSLRMLRTLRHLRPEQILHRLWRRARHPWFASAAYDRRLGDAGRAPVLAPPVSWPGEAEEGRRILAGRIRLIGQEGDVRGWDDSAQSLLWRFTLHYFEWLPHLAALGGDGAAAARRAVEDWLDRFERFHPVAWHPYPLSLRLFAWLAFAPFLEQGAGSVFVARFHRSLHRQARHLAAVWEKDVAGNHLIKNLKAEIAVALCLPGHQEWLPKALAALERELGRQILADGCHYERSPSYHLQVRADLAELATLFAAAGRPVPEALAAALGRMEPAAAFFRHGDGGLALFNDGTADWQGEPAAALPPQSLPEAGYWRLNAGNLLVLADCGPCCPDDLPAHAHADTLSFELSDGAERIVVNGGTYAYQDARWRPWFRSTPSHSTVAIDGGDSAEVYGAFRLGYRPRRFAVEAGPDSFTGRHDGWRRLGITHQRSLRLGSGRLDGSDRLSRPIAGPPHSVQARFLLHPGTEARLEEDGVTLRTVSGTVWRMNARGGTLMVEEGVYAPRFNEMHSIHVVVLSAILTGTEVILDWSLSTS